MRLVGLLVTVATLAAIYFFVIKPISDTTGDAFDSVAPAFESLRDAQEQAAEAQQQADQAAKTKGSPASLKQAQKLQRCIQRAGQDTAKLSACLNGR
jgi:hypothetical protein